MSADSDVQTVVQGLGGDRLAGYRVPGREFAAVFEHICVLEGKDAIYLDGPHGAAQRWVVYAESREILGSGASPLLAMIDALGGVAKRRETKLVDLRRSVSAAGMHAATAVLDLIEPRSASELRNVARSALWEVSTQISAAVLACDGVIAQQLEEEP